MKKLIFISVVLILVLTSCSRIDISNLFDEDIKTFDVTEATDEPSADNGSGTVASNSNQSLEDRFALIDFYMVSGYYTRNVVQEDVEYMEMFSFEKSNFIRITQTDIDREVYAYNYLSDDFTYMYYFDGVLTSKAVFNISTGAILEDEDGLSELLTIDAEELKIYFNTLLETAGIGVNELKSE